MDKLQAVRLQVLKDFSAAWNAHDIEVLMALMTDDCHFDGSAGAEVYGTRSEGVDDVRAAYNKMWEIFPDAAWNEDSHFVCGDRGVSEWRFTGTMADGARVETHGCDLFVFSGSKIKVKDSFRKSRPPLAAK